MKFLCDQMLVKLGWWLRAAGYNTVIIEQSMPDSDIVAMALQDGRMLITRDRHFLEFQKAAGCVVWLKANSVEECARELSNKISLSWTYRPFSRCLLCNQKLIVAGSEVSSSVPERVRERCDEYWVCRRCDKVYWLGTHTDSMLEKLKAWNSFYER